jgi:hypothetical protein
MFIVDLGGPCFSFQGLSYLLRAVSIFLENVVEIFQFFCEGIRVTEFRFCVSGNPRQMVCL